MRGSRRLNAQQADGQLFSHRSSVLADLRANLWWSCKGESLWREDLYLYVLGGTKEAVISKRIEN